MAAYAGGGTGSGDTHTSQIMNNSREKKMAAKNLPVSKKVPAKKTGMATKVGKDSKPAAVHAKKTAAKNAAIKAGTPVAGTPRAKKAAMQTVRQRKAAAAQKNPYIAAKRAAGSATTGSQPRNSMNSSGAFQAGTFGGGDGGY